jgi:hypothetical protein
VKLGGWIAWEQENNFEWLLRADPLSFVVPKKKNQQDKNNKNRQKLATKFFCLHMPPNNRSKTNWSPLSQQVFNTRYVKKLIGLALC